jgi:hypothetical protein
MWLSVIAEAAAVDRSLIFTFTPEPTVPAGFPGRVARVVESAGGRVLWVRLLVSDREQESRVVAADRQRFHKLTSISTLRRLRSQPAGEQPPADLVIDTEQSDPSTSADRIIEHFGLWAAPRHDRYPDPPG